MKSKGTDLLREVAAHWSALSKYREERLRCKNYTYGRQWNDPITVDGETITEEEYIISQGNIPLKNNLIRRIVRNVVGVFRNRYGDPGLEELGLEETPENILSMKRVKQWAIEGGLHELYSRTLEEFLIGGIAVHRKRIAGRGENLKVMTGHVTPESFFYDHRMRDPRGLDAWGVGEIHTVDFETLAARFARKPADIRNFERIYGAENSRCEVTEYWRKEIRRSYLCHDRLNGRCFTSRKEPKEEHVTARWKAEEVWRYYFIAPDGTILMEGDSPYPGGSHPYIFKAYPLIDGEVHSFVADCIDQQRYINRLITLYDWVMRASAKGVLLFPEGSLPDGVDIDEISEEWSRFNGVILFKPRAGMPLPQQISSNAANIGITELLNVQLKMMEDVSGVNSALQGQLSGGAVSGTLYEMQVRHSLSGLLDLLESYREFQRLSVKWELGMARDLKI